MNDMNKVSKNLPYDIDLRSTKTRKLLSSALLQLLDKKNFNKISVKDICETALVSRSGFYSHFEDKYHLLLYVLEELKLKLSEGLDFNEKSLQLNNLLTYTQEHDLLFKSLFSKETTLELRNMLDGILTDEIAEFLTVRNTIKKQEGPFSVDLMSVFLAGGLTQTIQWWVINDFPIPKEEVLKLLTII